MMRNVGIFALASASLLACGDNGAAECDTEIPGNICTIAGNGKNGYDKTADDEALVALEARMSLPQDTLSAPDGSIYVADSQAGVVRQYDANGRFVRDFGRQGTGPGEFNSPKLVA